jgi:hypothetical protein
MRFIISCMILFVGSNLAGCQSSSIADMTPEQWIYYAVDYQSYEKDYPDSSVNRADLIKHITNLEGSDLDYLLKSRFITPYLVLNPAFISGRNEENLHVALTLLNFLDQKGLNIYKQDSAGCSSFHMAIYFKEKDMLEILTSRYDSKLFKGNPEATVPLCRKDANELLN